MSNRRDFLKVAALAAGSGIMLGGCTAGEFSNTASAGFNMSGYRAPKIPKVRIGFVGLGMRGPGAVRRMTHIEGVEISSFCYK